MNTEPNHGVEALARRATECRECFRLGEVLGAPVDMAQPRWVGEKYWSSECRVVILMCNPGEGLNYPESTARLSRQLHDFGQGRISLGAILEPQWNSSWFRFYVDGLQLNVDEVAFANLAWCATSGNLYPRTVLERCFSRHTEPLLRLLSPNVVLAAGHKAQRFLRRTELLGTPHVIEILHHASRKGRKAVQDRLSEIRHELELTRSEARWLTSAAPDARWPTP